MNNYLLKNYTLSSSEMIQSLFVSEYGLRHLSQSKTQPHLKWGHRIIALIELCPLIGLVASIIEAIIAKKLKPNTHFTTLPFQNKKWLFMGSQYGCSDYVSISKIEAVRLKLESQQAFGILFNKDKVSGYLDGGNCTAMSFEFLASYFKNKKICQKEPNFRSEVLLNRIIQIGQDFALSSEKMRVLQAAYNTIEVRKLNISVDYSKNKIQSLANSHGLKIDYSSKEIDLNTINTENELRSHVDALPEGAFLVRLLKPADNEKLEEHGHTLVYVKDQGVDLFYDPNYGVIHLNVAEHTSVLYESFKNCLCYFETNKARFYRFASEH